MGRVTPATEAALLDAAERRYAYLLERGTDEQAALQRTWDAYERAYGENQKAIASNNRMFFNELTTIIEKGK